MTTEPTSYGHADQEVVEVLRIPPKDVDLPPVTAELLEAVERQLQRRLEIAGDVSNRLLYQLADVLPHHLDAFVMHHADHFARAVFQRQAEADAAAAVLIRHAFVVGYVAAKTVMGRPS